MPGIKALKHSLYVLCAVFALIAAAQTNSSDPPPTLTPSQTLDLHLGALVKTTQGNPDIEPHIVLDQQGRLLILYRDKKPWTSTGNWHLLRLSKLSSSVLQREEIIFNPVQDYIEIFGNSNWWNARTDLVLGKSGEVAYAILDGVVAHSKSKPEKRFLDNAVSIDLKTFKVLARRSFFDAGHKIGPLDYVRSWKADDYDDLATLRTLNHSWDDFGDPSWLATIWGPGLNILEESKPIKCDLYKPPELANIKPQNTTLRCGQSEEIEKLDATQLKHLSPCSSGWKLESPDQYNLLLSCFEYHMIWDTWNVPTRADLQIINSHTLASRGIIHLPKHQVTSYSIWHGNGQTIVAVLEDGERLKLYRLLD